MNYFLMFQVCIENNYHNDQKYIYIFNKTIYTIEENVSYTVYDIIHIY